MRKVIEMLEKSYDMVVIDTPPTSVVSDAIPLIKQAKGVLVVSRLGTSTRDATVRLRDQLANLDAPTLGVVINAVSQPATYGYGYGYGYEQGRRRMWRPDAADRSRRATSSDGPPSRVRQSDSLAREDRRPPLDRRAGSRSPSVSSYPEPTTPQNPPTKRRPIPPR